MGVTLFFVTMQALSNSENTALGMVTAASIAVILQPTLYYRNAIQQGRAWKFLTPPRKMYRGMVPSSAAQVGELGLQFLLTGVVKHLILSLSGRKQELGADDLDVMSDGEVITASLLGGALASLYVSPAELLMIQQQNFGKTLPRTISSIVQSRGVLGLYRGLPAAMLRDGTWTMSLFAATPIVQAALESNFQGLNQSVSGFVASLSVGVLCGVVTAPFDLIKTSQQGDMDQRNYRGMLDTFLKQRHRLLSGVSWRIANVAGTILIANEFRMRVAPLMFPDKYIVKT